MTFIEGKVLYDSNYRTWTCAICSLANNKYNWAQIIRHVNAKNNNNENNAKKEQKGMRVGGNDIIIQMENDYGE